MSVLIKGVEMPHNCFLCNLSVLNGERLFCEITKEEVLRTKIAIDCPLIEVPPHGRLIDADALQKDIIQDMYYYEGVLPYIKASLTIIPAELPKEE